MNIFNRLTYGNYYRNLNILVSIVFLIVVIVTSLTIEVWGNMFLLIGLAGADIVTSLYKKWIFYPTWLSNMKKFNYVMQMNDDADDYFKNEYGIKDGEGCENNV